MAITVNLRYTGKKGCITGFFPRNDFQRNF